MHSPGRIALSLACLVFAATPAAGQPTDDGSRRLVATRTSAPVVIDGHLREDDWRTAPVADRFIQSEPHAGEPASEATEVRVLYDDRALYIGVFAAHRDPRHIIVNELRRDFDGSTTDWVAVILDPFHDRRNGYQFGVNPAGAMWDSQKFNEGRERNLAWDGVWQARTSIGATGWYAELEIPFRTLQVPDLDSQVWGINFQRHLQGRLENSYWSPVPRQYFLDRLSLAGTLEGLSGVRQGANLRVKPYAAVRARATGATTTVADAGLDAKYGITPSLTADLSINTDFSQVEADVAQAGATRFGVLFPEKREFFLENSGVFQFGGGSDRAGQISLAPGTSAGGRDNSVRGDLALFFSRRVGLSSDGEQIPIEAGARLSGRIGRTVVGALHVRQAAHAGSEPARFSVARVRRNLGMSSDVGVMLVSKDERTRGSRVVGVDVNLRPAPDLLVYGYAAASLDGGAPGPDRDGSRMAAQGGLAWRDQRWVVDGSIGMVGRAFVDEAGFVPRTGVRRTQGLAGRRVRPRATARWLREIYPAVGLTDVRREDGSFDSRYWEHRLTVTFERGATVELGANPNDEQLQTPFVVHRARGLVVAPGRYRFTDAFVAMASSPSRPVVLTGRLSSGGYYGGERQVAQAGASVRLNAHLGASLAATLDRVTPDGRRATGALIVSRVNLGVSTRLFATLLVQHHSGSGQWDTNLRINYIHAPLSDVFVVVSDRRVGATGERDRSVAVKVTRLVAF